MVGWIVLLVVLFDLCFVAFVVGFLVRSAWKPLEESFPAQSVAEPSVKRSFQSFSLGLINLGWSVHVTVDDVHLHLEPARFFKWFGLSSVSIPWDSIEWLGGGVLFKSMAKVRAAKTEIAGPAWCFELARPASSPDS